MNTRDLIHAVNLQLLLSSLSDSCVPQTGLPAPELLEDLHGKMLFQKDHCLVMVMSIMHPQPANAGRCSASVIAAAPKVAL